ncbi:probable protein ABIL5 isoform X2 [Lolium rigidum]|uniref:probable protein ABIL5 isoform X2 n=1 Tax=Lolium rigidum TaxID=89674 RepID=UPI001F5C3CAD|nr:probable protein ABIL5 isoform X2 [Lolium rigidum]
MDAEMDAEAGEAGRQRSPAAPFVRSSSRLGAAQSFDGALRELKDLRFQLHQAADCCEKAFLGTEQKRLILDSTKSYICDAVVTVIDHLGTVLSKLEHQLEDKTEVTQTEQKITFLKQRLLTCEQYAISLNLLALRMDTGAVQYHRRYLSQSTETNNKENVTDSRGHPVPGANRTLKPYDVESTIGREVTVAVADVGNPASITRSFSFRAEQDAHIAPGVHKKKKASHRSNILAFLKRSKQHA